jgi:predicted transcriptional regulator
MTLMQILEKKGHLKKSAVERRHVYRAARPRRQTVSATAQRLSRPRLQRVCKTTAGATWFRKDDCRKPRSKNSVSMLEDQK